MLKGTTVQLAKTAELPACRPAPTVFEVGVIYRKNSRYFLAVDARRLITFEDGKVVQVRPHSTYDAVRSLQVDELCAKWGISVARLDEATAQFLPAPKTKRTRMRGTRCQREREEALWRSLRRSRIST